MKSGSFSVFKYAASFTSDLNCFFFWRSSYIYWITSETRTPSHRSPVFLINLNSILPADVLYGSFVTHSFLPQGPSVGEKWMRNERTPKDVCGEAISTPEGIKNLAKTGLGEPSSSVAPVLWAFSKFGCIWRSFYHTAYHGALQYNSHLWTLGHYKISDCNL